jgi:phosphoribosylformimino-5-aminoimidazole carboxamide ribotide isomerase
MDILPAIDLINGACVRLTGGDFARQTTYAADPLAQAQYFEQLGATHLHLVDLDGARAREPALVGEWLARFGAERIIIGADFKGDYIAVSAWTEQSTQRLPDFIGAYLAAGATTFICTDVSRDGQLQGPATDTYAALRQQFPAARFVASGGVTTVADVAAMRELGMAGAIIGKAIYEGTITEAELRTELQPLTGTQA